MTMVDTAAAPAAAIGGPELSAVLCGSFRRDVDGLRQAFDELTRLYRLIAPSSVGFVDASVDFVRLPHQSSESVVDLEQAHLEAVTSADFVWLHCPEGYVGSSAAMELGHARALGVPVFAAQAPQDVTLREFVTVVAGPVAVASALIVAPGKGLSGLQRYYHRVSERRGWANESAQDTLLLLTEEMGELARAVRKSTGIRRDGEYPGVDVGLEIADVQLYLMHLANALGVDIADAVTAKEAINQRRFESGTAPAEVA